MNSMYVTKVRAHVKRKHLFWTGNQNPKGKNQCHRGDAENAEVSTLALHFAISAPQR